MMYRLILIALLLSFVPSVSAQEDCEGEWRDEFAEITAEFEDNLISMSDEPEIVSEKMTNLYIMYFRLIMLDKYAPGCAHEFITSFAEVVDLQADWGMAMTIYNSSDLFSDMDMYNIASQQGLRRQELMEAIGN